MAPLFPVGHAADPEQPRALHGPQFAAVIWPSFGGTLGKAKRLVVESNDYFNKHFLIGLVLRQLYKSLHSSFAGVQYKAIQVLRNIIETNDIDPRCVYFFSLLAIMRYYLDKSKIQIFSRGKMMNKSGLLH